MAVELVQDQLNIPKESKDVVDFLANVVDGIKAKRPLAELAAAELPDLIKAVEGYQAIGEELKDGHRADLIAYFVKKVAAEL